MTPAEWERLRQSNAPITLSESIAAIRAIWTEPVALAEVEVLRSGDEAAVAEAVTAWDGMGERG